MPNFVKKKLQVFVSSTYTDLIQERQAAVEAILTAGHIPAGMELFTSGDETQLEVINQWIDESDIYLLILGGRYGSLEPKTGKSYTHLEYEYAINQGKPSFACVITEAAIDKRVKEKGLDVAETENASKLKDFRSFIFTKVHKPWDDFKDIKITVSESLANFARRDDLQGWVRPNTEENIPAHIAEENAELRKKNEELRSQLAENGKVNFRGLSFNELKEKLEAEDLLKLLESFESSNNVRISVTDTSIKPKQTTRLIRLGLVSKGIVDLSTASYLCSLTNDGQTFLNMLEVWKLKQNPDS